jgi:hypothetical protein
MQVEILRHADRSAGTVPCERHRLIVLSCMTIPRHAQDEEGLHVGETRNREDILATDQTCNCLSQEIEDSFRRVSQNCGHQAYAVRQYRWRTGLVREELGLGDDREYRGDVGKVAIN